MSYPFPWREFGALAWSLVTGRRRDMVADAAAMWRRSTRRPLILGAENIPASGPVVLVANHYQRRGLWIAWPAGLITLATAARRSGSPVRWVVTGELRLAQWRNGGPILPGSRLLLRRVAATYGLIELPGTDRFGSAAAVRRVFRRLESGEAVGIFPEGLAKSSSSIGRPAPGFGRLAVLLSKRNIPLVPVAVSESDGRMIIRLGEAAIISDGEIAMRLIENLLQQMSPEEVENAPSLSGIVG